MPGFELVGVEEKKEVMSVFDSGGGVFFRHGFEALRKDSYKVMQFEDGLKDYFDGTRCLAVSSGTAALRVALAACRFERGKKVVTQAFTFVATVEAIHEAGLVPVALDVDETLNLCPERLRDFLQKESEVVAIIVVHMLGSPGYLDKISAVCNEFGVVILEDAAWGLGGKYDGVKLGSFGEMSALSFDHAKIITTGEGGAVVTENPILHQRASAWHDHGHENSPSVPRWRDSRQSSGFNFRMSELQAAVGIAQLQKLHQIVEKQRIIHELIEGLVSDYAGVSMRPVPEGALPSCDACIVRVDSRDKALKLRKVLLSNSVGTKILPEAISWHFAGQWEHMPFVITDGNLLQSRMLLESCVAIPISLKSDEAQLLDRLRIAFNGL